MDQTRKRIMIAKEIGEIYRIRVLLRVVQGLTTELIISYRLKFFSTTCSYIRLQPLRQKIKIK